MILREHSFVRSKWLNGKGETLQLIIHPQSTDFKLQQFVYRLSVASLAPQPTKFSQFPNYNRFLLILEGGTVNIFNHIKKETYYLQKMQNVISFDGADELESFPQQSGLDFNLFVSKNGAGELRIIDLQAEKTLQLLLGNHHFFNCSKKAFQLFYGKQLFVVNQGEMFVCRDLISVKLFCEQSIKIILASVYISDQ